MLQMLSLTWRQGKNAPLSYRDLKHTKHLHRMQCARPSTTAQEFVLDWAVHTIQVFFSIYK